MAGGGRPGLIVLPLMLVAGAIGAGAALAVDGNDSSSADSPKQGRTLKLFGDVAHETSSFIDAAPKSPSPNPRDPSFRLSPGDRFQMVTPILDRRGGKKIGTLHADGVLMEGTSFGDAVIVASGVLAVQGGDITLAGLFKDPQAHAFAVTGGTGAYNGAHGSVITKLTPDQSGSNDEVRLLP